MKLKDLFGSGSNVLPGPPKGKHIGAVLDRICYGRGWKYRIMGDGSSLLIYEPSSDSSVKEIPKGFYNAGNLAGSVEEALKELGTND